MNNDAAKALPILNKLDMGEARVVGVDDKLGLLDFGRMDRIRG